jgi:hypothetical protein
LRPGRQCQPSLSTSCISSIYLSLSWCLASSWQRRVAIPLTIHPDVGKNLSSILYSALQSASRHVCHSRWTMAQYDRVNPVCRNS